MLPNPNARHPRVERRSDLASPALTAIRRSRVDRCRRIDVSTCPDNVRRLLRGNPCGAPSECYVPRGTRVGQSVGVAELETPVHLGYSVLDVRQSHTYVCCWIKAFSNCLQVDTKPA
jgi:hypothetical protein